MGARSNLAAVLFLFSSTDMYSCTAALHKDCCKPDPVPTCQSRYI